MLNYEATSLERLKEDFNALVNNQKSSLILKSEVVTTTQYIALIMESIEDNLKNVSYNPSETKVFRRRQRQSRSPN